MQDQNYWYWYRYFLVMINCIYYILFCSTTERGFRSFTIKDKITGDNVAIFSVMMSMCFISNTCVSAVLRRGWPCLHRAPRKIICCQINNLLIIRYSRHWYNYDAYISQHNNQHKWAGDFCFLHTPVWSDKVANNNVVNPILQICFRNKSNLPGTRGLNHWEQFAVTFLRNAYACNVKGNQLWLLPPHS